jgi:hypothetical protein
VAATNHGINLISLEAEISKHVVGKGMEVTRPLMPAQHARDALKKAGPGCG